MARYFPGCETKKHYDTEFEAQRAAAITEDYLKAEMVPYQCGPHWHITHKDPSKRRGYGMYYRCPHCKQIIKRKRIEYHKRVCPLSPHNQTEEN